MIEPTQDDIGRGVIYHGMAGEREHGVISSFNEDFVFVRYGKGSTAAATKRDQLAWEFPRNSDVSAYDPRDPKSPGWYDRMADRADDMRKRERGE